MKLIVGLGNPGKKYQLNRHNVGFMVVDRLADNFHLEIDQEDFKSLMIKTKIYNQDVIIAKPQTFMNLSGQAVVALMNFYKIDKNDIVIVYDDMDIPRSEIKLKETGSGGTHNGISNVLALLGTNDIKKIKVGIGHPPYANQVDFVLSDPQGEDKILIDQGIGKAVEALKEYLKNDFSKAMNVFNRNNE